MARLVSWLGDDGLEESDGDDGDGSGRGGRERPTGGGEEDDRGVMSVLDRVLSRASAKSVNPGPPPDGGMKAWISGQLSR